MSGITANASRTQDGENQDEGGSYTDSSFKEFDVHVCHKYLLSTYYAQALREQHDKTMKTLALRELISIKGLQIRLVSKTKCLLSA